MSGEFTEAMSRAMDNLWNWSSPHREASEFTGLLDILNAKDGALSEDR